MKIGDSHQTLNYINIIDIEFSQLTSEIEYAICIGDSHQTLNYINIIDIEFSQLTSEIEYAM